MNIAETIKNKFFKCKINTREEYVDALVEIYQINSSNQSFKMQDRYQQLLSALEEYTEIHNPRSLRSHELAKLNFKALQN